MGAVRDVALGPLHPHDRADRRHANISILRSPVLLSGHALAEAVAQSSLLRLSHLLQIKLECFPPQPSVARVVLRNLLSVLGLWIVEVRAFFVPGIASLPWHRARLLFRALYEFLHV